MYIFTNQQTGSHWGHHLAKGPWAEEAGLPFRESRVKPVEEGTNLP